MTITELKTHYALIYRTLTRERAMREKVLYNLDRERKVAEIDNALAALDAIKNELKARLIMEDGGSDQSAAVQETLFALPTVHENAIYF